MNIYDYDIEKAIDYEWFIFNKAQEGISKIFVKNIRTHFNEHKDVLLYIRLPPNSASFTRNVTCYTNLRLDRTSRPEELKKIIYDAQRATETFEIGVAVGEHISCFIAFNKQDSLDKQTGKFSRYMISYLKKELR